MSVEDKEKKGVTRRQFVRGAAVGAAAAAGGTVLAGCGVAEATPCPTCEPCPTAAAPSAEAAPAPTKASWEVLPDAIPDSEITETVEADIVVIGAGIAGLTACVSAAEAGAKTVLIEKAQTTITHGLHNAAVNSRMQQAAGISIDKDEVVSAIMQFSGYRGNERIVRLWADNSGEIMNWLLDMAEEAGNEVVLDPTTKEWFFPNFPTIHTWMPGNQADLATMLENKAKDLGAELRFETPAEQLLSDGQGRITGVVAPSPDGGYVKLNAAKAVILCTGGYGNNPEMVQAWTSWRTQGLPCIYGPAVNTGDGHKMALWAGAAIDDLPHCAMHFDMPTQAGFFSLGRQPWLYVNVNGERFMNEDLPWALEVAQMLQQPGHVAWAVWDEKWDDEWPIMKSQCCKNMGEPTNLWDPAALPEAVEAGTVLKADTLEELAALIGVPVETFVATATRYTEMARNGEDEDFGKHKDRLTTLEKAPYYATQIGCVNLVTLGGLKINTSLQVLDTEGQVIPGLYAAGNASGCFFGDEYPTTAPGLSHGRAWTFGRLAALNAAAEA